MKFTNVILCVVLCVLVFASGDLFSQDMHNKIMVLQNGKLLTITKGIIEKGSIVIQDGKIIKVGKRIKVPAGAKIIDITGKTVMPGIVLAHSRAGTRAKEWDSNENGDPVMPELRIIDSINPHNSSLKWLRSGGITTILVAPESKKVISGQCALIKPVEGTIEDMILKFPAAVQFSMGEEPKKVYQPQRVLPSSRMGISYLLRRTLTETEEYMEKWQKYRKDTKNIAQPERDEKYEILAKILEKKLPVILHCNRSDDIMNAIRLSEKFGFEIILDHCSEGYMVADEIGKRKLPVIITNVGTMWKTWEKQNHKVENAEILRKNGAIIAFQAGEGTPYPEKDLLLLASVSLKKGFPRDEVLRAITINPARMFGVEHRIGSIEKGKDADLVILDGDPLSIKTRIVSVIINGKIYSDSVIREKKK